MQETTKASREQWWSEIDSEEKTARLRQRVKEVERTLGELRNQISDLLKHSHGDSELLIPMQGGYSMAERAYTRGKATDDVYF